MVMSNQGHGPGELPQALIRLLAFLKRKPPLRCRMRLHGGQWLETPDGIYMEFCPRCGTVYHILVRVKGE